MIKQKGKVAADVEAAEVRRLHHVDCVRNIRADGSTSENEYRCDYTNMWKLRMMNDFKQTE